LHQNIVKEKIGKVQLMMINLMMPYLKKFKMLVKKTPDNGLVTDALKLKRKAIEQKYKDDI
jgi:long-subunit acyl-CoA synthetase (AMP-forming)